MIAGLKLRNQPDPKWKSNPFLVAYWKYLQSEDRLPEVTARYYTVCFKNVAETTGLSFEDLADCDVDLTVAHAYPNRKSGNLNRERVSLRRWQDFRKSNYSEIPESSGAST